MQAIWHMLVTRRLRRWAYNHPEAADKLDRAWMWVGVTLALIAAGGAIISYSLR